LDARRLRLGLRLDHDRVGTRRASVVRPWPRIIGPRGVVGAPRTLISAIVAAVVPPIVRTIITIITIVARIILVGSGVTRLVHHRAAPADFAVITLLDAAREKDRGGERRHRGNTSRLHRSSSLMRAIASHEVN
jgi:hypothetical protein